MFPNWPAPVSISISRNIPSALKRANINFTLRENSPERYVVCCELNTQYILDPRRDQRESSKKKKKSRIYRINWFKSSFRSSAVALSLDCGAITMMFWYVKRKLWSSKRIKKTQKNNDPTIEYFNHWMFLFLFMKARSTLFPRAGLTALIAGVSLSRSPQHTSERFDLEDEMLDLRFHISLSEISNLSPLSNINTHCRLWFELCAPLKEQLILSLNCKGNLSFALLFSQQFSSFRCFLYICAVVQPSSSPSISSFSLVRQHACIWNSQENHMWNRNEWGYM